MSVFLQRKPDLIVSAALRYESEFLRNCGNPIRANCAELESLITVAVELDQKTGKMEKK